FFNIASWIDMADAEPVDAPSILPAYGGKSLHERSHGESFLALLQYRFFPDGIYLMDEPEAALSPQRQLSLLGILHNLMRKSRDTQFIISTIHPSSWHIPAPKFFRSTEAPFTPSLTRKLPPFR